MNIFEVIKNCFVNHYVNKNDLEMNDLFLSSVNEIRYPIFYKPVYYTYNVEIKENIGNNNEITFLKNEYPKIFIQNTNQLIFDTITSDFFDVDYTIPGLTMCVDNKTDSDYHEYNPSLDGLDYNKIYEQDYVNITGLLGANTIATHIFNLNANYMYDYNNICIRERDYIAYRYIQLNDYTSSYIKIPVIYSTSNNNILEEFYNIGANVYEEFINNKKDLKKPENRKDFYENVRKRVVLFLLKHENIRNQTIRVNFPYGYGFILEGYYSPEHVFSTYQSNNISKYFMLYLDTIEILTDIICSVFLSGRKYSSVSVDNVSNHYEVIFDIKLEQENIKSFSSFLQEFVNTFKNIFYKTYDYVYEIENVKRTNFSSDFLSLTQYINDKNINVYYPTLYRYKKINDEITFDSVDEINRPTISSRFFSSLLYKIEIYNSIYYREKNRLGNYLIEVNNFFHNFIFDAYEHMDSIKNKKHIDFVKIDNAKSFSVVKNKVDVSKVIYLVLNPVVNLCVKMDNENFTIEKAEGAVKYTKVRFITSRIFEKFFSPLVTKIDNLDLNYAENILRFLSNPIAYDLLFMPSSTDDADIDEESMLDAVGYGLSSIEELDNLTDEETEEDDDLYDEGADDETGLDDGDEETDTVEDDGTGNVIDETTDTAGGSESGTGGTGGAGTGGAGTGGTGGTGSAGGDSGGAGATGGDVDDSDYGVPYFTAGNC